MDTLKHYTGNKKIDGLWQWIVNRIPPHTLYYELFAGSATIARILPPTAKKILVDLNPRTVELLQQELGSSTVSCICADAVQILSSLPDQECTDKNDCNRLQSKATVQARVPWPVKTETTVLPAVQMEMPVRSHSTKQLYPLVVQQKMSVPAGIDENNCTYRYEQIKITVPAGTDKNDCIGSRPFIYADPPYMKSTRRGKRRLYKYEMMEDAQHEQLCRAFSTVNADCMISHPKNKLYDDLLQGWNYETFEVSYHGKPFTECIYYNYTKPTVLQTYDFVGSDCWDRQRVKRKIERLAKKLADLPALERNAVIARAIR